uniref:Uncharacterized protein n=1 Tax=Magallana gigas TaxID=29159 RepID=K1PWX0_MAGGI
MDVESEPKVADAGADQEEMQSLINGKHHQNLFSLKYLPLNRSMYAVRETGQNEERGNSILHCIKQVQDIP